MGKKTRFLVLGACLLLFTTSVLWLYFRPSPPSLQVDSSLSRRVTIRPETAPEKITRFMWHNFSFESDQKQFGEEEYWQAPQELMKNKKGDCEDFAVFAHEFLRRNGIPSYLLNVYGDRFAHTITVYKENGKYNAIDGRELKAFGAHSLLALVDRIHPEWTQSVIVAFSSASHRAIRIKDIKRAA